MQSLRRRCCLGPRLLTVQYCSWTKSFVICVFLYLIILYWVPGIFYLRSLVSRHLPFHCFSASQVSKVNSLLSVKHMPFLTASSEPCTFSIENQVSACTDTWKVNGRTGRHPWGVETMASCVQCESKLTRHFLRKELCSRTRKRSVYESREKGMDIPGRQEVPG